jgi:four helix bundle protein
MANGARRRRRDLQAEGEADDDNDDEYEDAESSMFDHERLDVYKVELEFVAWVSDLFEVISKAPATARSREVCDHLDRASLSILFNTTEGNGKRQKQIRSKFFDDARGSATECAAALDALVVKRFVTKERIQAGKELLERIVSMLTRLVQLYETERKVVEDSEDYKP